MKSMKSKAGETWKRGLAVSAICFIFRKSDRLGAESGPSAAI
jgi:hypothetical protein